MSVSDWKTMPRKQQEVVLKVWENVLETVKFRAAKDKGDFDTNLHGLHAPKHTPFDTALAALKELCGTPKFYNPCPGCIFLGNHQDGPPKKKELVKPELMTTWYDLYYCDQGQKIGVPMLSARFGDAPKLDEFTAPEISIGMFDPNSTIGQDLGYISGTPEKSDHPALWQARYKASQLGLISPELGEPLITVKV